MQLLKAQLRALPQTSLARSAVLLACVMWMSMLRFKHLQWSVLLDVTSSLVHAACLRGKRRPGFRWAVPCLGVLGVDIGLEPWRAWNGCCVRRGVVVQRLLANPITGAPYSLPQFVKAVRLVHNPLLGDNAALFTSCSLRTVMSTVADIQNMRAWPSAIGKSNVAQTVLPSTPCLFDTQAID